MNRPLDDLLSCPECGARATDAGPQGTAGAAPTDAAAVINEAEETRAEFVCPNGHTWTV